MRSHHAPTKHLLERFSFRDKKVRSGRSIWVYEKGRRPRPSSNFASECAQNGYFAGSSDGASEIQTDMRFNVDYEVPFNELLPRLDTDLQIFDSPEVKLTCSRYLAHIFHRSKARKRGSQLLHGDLIKDYRQLAEDPKNLLRYAAKISVLARRSIEVAQLKTVIVKEADKLASDPGRQAFSSMTSIEQRTQWQTNSTVSTGA